MILITIDELKGEKQKQIEDIANKKAYIKDVDHDIPFDEIEIMITYGSKKDWEVLDDMPNLKWIQIFQTGIERVPLEKIHARDILISNVKNIYGTPMSEYVMSIVLYQIRELERFIQNKKIKNYDRTKLVDEAEGRTIGIFGTGAVGKEVAKKAQAFDMNVLGFNTTGNPVEHFDQTYTWENKPNLIKMCDFIVLLLPLIDQTYHFLGAKEFEVMKDNAYIINIGRGPLIDETALIEALDKEKIKGAALDVFYEEPLPETSPLWDTKNLIITPHLSGKTQYFFDRCISIFNENYQAYTIGQSLKFEIDFVKGY